MEEKEERKNDKIIIIISIKNDIFLISYSLFENNYFCCSNVININYRPYIYRLWYIEVKLFPAFFFFKQNFCTGDISISKDFETCDTTWLYVNTRRDTTLYSLIDTVGQLFAFMTSRLTCLIVNKNWGQTSVLWTRSINDR